MLCDSTIIFGSPHLGQPKGGDADAYPVHARIEIDYDGVGRLPPRRESSSAGMTRRRELMIGVGHGCDDAARPTDRCVSSYISPGFILSADTHLMCRHLQISPAVQAHITEITSPPTSEKDRHEGA